ncbi:MAG: creatininase family protein [Treponema sp.]|nr:creatininase family protein [Treponema sp.]
MTKEVRYQMLRPADLVQRREACPVVYIPIGTLEWHGLHNPVGADSLQAEYLAIRCAQIGGGLVFPPLYYGESRTESLMDSTAADHEEIAKLMHLDPQNFSPEKFIYSEAEQSENYIRLLAHILNEADTLGFEVGVIIAGHYPLIDYARAAALLHNKRRRRTGRMLAWATFDYLWLKDKYDFAGDHAGGWETSHCMAVDPSLVDLSALKPRGENLTGVMWAMDPHDANAEFGKKTFEESADIIVKETLHRLNNKALYDTHGMYLAEGLWKK